MIEPADTLRAEHETMQGLLSVLDGMAARLRSDVPVPREDLADVMTVIVEFADRCHHAKEEDVLFPALASASPQVGAEIARRLTSDHQAFRKIAASLRESVPRAGRSRVARDQLGKLLSTYARVLREHVEIEEQTLLPEFERAMEFAARQRIAEEFERLEREDVGLGMHEAYDAIVRRLGRTYVE